MPREDENRPEKCQLAEMLFAIGKQCPEVFSVVNPAMMLATKQCFEKGGDVRFPKDISEIPSAFFYQHLQQASAQLAPYAGEDPAFKIAHEGLDAESQHRQNMMLSLLSV